MTGSNHAIDSGNWHDHRETVLIFGSYVSLRAKAAPKRGKGEKGKGGALL
jgi:hypothetical protein